MANPNPRNAGMHTLRHVEADIRDQLSDHKAGLQAELADTARRTEESAFDRAQSLTLQEAALLRARIQEDRVDAEDRTKAVAADARAGDEANRVQLVDTARALRGEITDVRAELPGLREEIRNIAAAHDVLRGAHADLRQLVDAVRHEVAQESILIQTRITEVVDQIDRDVAEKFRSCQDRLDRAEESMNIAVGEARREAVVATDTAALVERALLQHVDDARVFSTDEARRYSEEVAAALRKEDEALAEKFQRQILDYEVGVDSRVAAFDAVLRQLLDTSITDCLSNANKHSEAKVATLASQVDEVVRATREDIESLEQRHTESTTQWRDQLRDTKKNFEAANGLAQRSIDKLHDITAQQGRAHTNLRDALAEARSNFADGLSSARAQLQEKASKTEALESSRVANAAAADTEDKLEKFAGVLDCHRRWLDGRVHHLSTRCHGAEVEAFDAKARSGAAARWGPPFALPSHPSHHALTGSTASLKASGAAALTDTLPAVAPMSPPAPPQHPLTPRMAARRQQQALAH